MKTKLTIEMETETVEKLRKFFPGKIGEILERKAEQAIQEMEDPKPLKPISRVFKITQTDDGWINYAPQRFMEKKEYVQLISIVNPGVEITSELICDLVDRKIQSQRTTQVGRLPERQLY